MIALPFTVEQFHGVFRDYNIAVWPAQWFLVAMALVAVAAVPRSRLWSIVAVSGILGVQPDLVLTVAGLMGIGRMATAGRQHRTLKA